MNSIRLDLISRKIGLQIGQLIKITLVKELPTPSLSQQNEEKQRRMISDR